MTLFIKRRKEKEFINMANSKDKASLMAKGFHQWGLIHRDFLCSLLTKYPLPNSHPPKDYLPPNGTCCTDSAGAINWMRPEYTTFYPYSRRACWLLEKERLLPYRILNYYFLGWLIDNASLFEEGEKERKSDNR
jgi:hypothetical protein